MSGNFISDRHALYVGWIMGLALRYDIPLRPVLDDEGNYTDKLAYTVPFRETTTITFIVPPPPDDWTFS